MERQASREKPQLRAACRAGSMAAVTAAAAAAAEEEEEEEALELPLALRLPPLPLSAELRACAASTSK